VTERLTLASRSPQRSAILEQLGIAFRVEVPDVPETREGEPRDLVAENACRKARACLERRCHARSGQGHEGGLVLAADTAVALDALAYGKPADEDQAREWLGRLSGRQHEVWGGLVLSSGPGDETVSAVRTRVKFRSLSETEIDWYVATGEWRERAGGYAIQGRGAALVEAIEGDFWNVVGLPVAELLNLAPHLLVGDERRGPSARLV
jgi:septum formation protein